MIKCIECSKFANNILLSIILTLAFIVPDFISAIFIDNRTIIDYEFCSIILLFSFFVSFLNIRFVAFLLILFCIIESVQFLHLFYFGSYISPNIIENMINNYDEVFLSTTHHFGKYFYIPLIIIIPYLSTYFMYKKYNHARYKNNIMAMFVVIFILIVPYRVIHSPNPAVYYPNPFSHSLRNSLYAFSSYFLKILPNNLYTMDHYVPYIISLDLSKDKLPTNIVLIFGESLTYNHMSLYGYKRKTTPNLDNLSKNKNFFFYKAISTGLDTKCSIPYFFNITREAGNISQILSKESNIFKLAKDKSYKTFFISNQNSNLLRDIGVNYIDFLLTEDMDRKRFIDKDETLYKISSDLNFANKNFIVLHQRNIHDPYDVNYNHRPEFIKYVDNDWRVDSYDNGVLYADYVINNIIETYTHKLSGDIVFIVTSDHGEMLGENGKFGHVTLDADIAQVPVIIYATQSNALLRKLANIPKSYITHYELGLLIAKLLGYKIINKNHTDDSFYIIGNIFGSEYIKIHLPSFPL